MGCGTVLGSLFLIHEGRGRYGYRRSAALLKAASWPRGSDTWITHGVHAMYAMSGNVGDHAVMLLPAWG